MPIFYVPDLLYHEDQFSATHGLLVADDGLIEEVRALYDAPAVPLARLAGKALLPGLVNGHSHSFQRLIRGVAEHRGSTTDDFWTWRTIMYRAASTLSPGELYGVARMAFLEMILSGITAVGEFHYIHRQQNGAPYEDPNLLSKTVIDAAVSVGLRICLLRVAYARAGYAMPPNPGQVRFYEATGEYLQNMARLAEDLRDAPATVTCGVAPHSIRAVTLDGLKQIHAWSESRQLPCHMHMAEQRAEIVACEQEHGVSPVRLLQREGLLSSRLTLVHAIHTAPDEFDALASSQTTICSCPSTERNLGDGIINAEYAVAEGVPFSFGSDSQATIDLLEDARELDYHLRLQRQQRVILDRVDGRDLSTRLFGYATRGGAKSLGLTTGALVPGTPADFFTVDLNDVSIAGSAQEELMPTIVFSLSRAAIRDVFVGGSGIVTDAAHPLQREIVESYKSIAHQVSLR
jgi:formimidoylglutamate deiminase